MIAKRLSLADRLSLGTLGVTCLATAATFSSLPARVATHFDWRGVPNSWQPRALAAVMLPAIALSTLGLYRWVAPRLRGSVAGLPWIGTATVSFLCILHICLLGYAKDPRFDVSRATSLACGALFVALGLLLPRVRRNPWVGVRTPWTLRSAEAWARTQRLAGWAFCAGGLVIGSAAVLVPSAALGIVAVTALGIAVATMLFSWRISRQPS